MFVPGYLLDAEGRVLYGCDGEDDEDPDATWPRVIGEVPVADPVGAAMHAASKGLGDDEPEGESPDAARVARRALALAAVTARAMMEDDVDLPEAPANLQRLRQWVDDLKLTSELEPEEWQVLAAPHGSVDRQHRINGIWRLEGLAVLGWALNRFVLPPHDQTVSPGDLWRAMALMDADRGRAILSESRLRPKEEIKALHNRLLGVHWRLREYSLRPKNMDFAEFARTCWFGPMDITDLPLIDGDLAIRGQRIDRVSRDDFSAVMSTAQERHQAVNWLWEGPELYSEAHTST